eukprot:3867466-Prorocentrum_lima.AAC.1
MTSSLVGSEMCIRDRYSREARTPCLGIARQLAEVIMEELRMLEADEKAAAVSYTHLTLPTICSV